MGIDFDLDDIDWGEELERASKASKAPVTAKRSQWSGVGNVRTTIIVRGETAEWLQSKGVRFTLHVDSSRRVVKLTPNNEAGKFEFAELRGGPSRFASATSTVGPTASMTRST